jgi:hypothetical protein
MRDGGRAGDRPLSTAVHLALHDGQFIEAIKLLRAETGGDLAAAKARIDRAVAADPVLRERFAAHRKRVRSRLIVTVLAVDAALLGLALLWWFSR